MAQADIPYYLRADVATDPGKIDIFNTDTLSSVKYDANQVNDVWQNMSDEMNKVGDYIWDPVKKTWNSALQGVTNLETDLQKKVSDAYSTVKWEVIFWVGAALVVVVIVARSGILNQASSFIPGGKR